MPETGVETADAVSVILAQLNGDAQVGLGGTFGLLGWHKDIAELATPLPAAYAYGIVGWQGGTRITYPGPAFQAIYGLLLVKIVGITGMFNATIAPAYKRVYSVLTGSQSSNADITMFGKLFQEVPIDYTETPAGAPKISHLGGAWRILAG
jgi:hypothetical protein